MRSPYLVIGGAGVLCAAWVVLGRGLFGLLGSFTPLYVGILGLPIIFLHLLIARGLVRTAKLGFATRPRTLITLIVAWLLMIVLGFTIPDKVDGSIHSIMTGDTAGLIGMAIGISNPLGIISIGLLVASVICTVFDARDPHESEDAILDAAQDS